MTDMTLMGGRSRRWRSVLSAAPAVVLIVTMIGQLVRDRALIFALMMYAPVLPVAVGTLAWDLFRRGRSVRGIRFGVSAIALCALAWRL